MSETYCGKICSECTEKEILNCPGCKAGPGRLFGGDCEIARCCRDKGQEACGTCDLKWNCDIFRSRGRQQDDRKRKIEAGLRQRQAVAEIAPVLGRWLWVLFWLVVPASIAGLMESDTVAEIAPKVFSAGRILSTACNFAYGIVLLFVSFKEDRYRTAGICDILGVGGLLAIRSVFGDATWTMFLILPLTIVSLVGVYNEYMAHGDVLTGIDDDLSAKWKNLWKWYIGMYLGIFGGIFVEIIIPILGVLIIIATALGTIAVSILKLVYLYKTAKLFRDYQTDAS